MIIQIIYLYINFIHFFFGRIIHHQMEQLLNAIFTCWEDKKISYLQNIIQEFNNNESTVNNNNNNDDDGDANWATKPSKLRLLLVYSYQF